MAEKLGNSWHLCPESNSGLAPLILGWLLKFQTLSKSPPVSHHQMPKCVHSCIPASVYWCEFTVQRPASRYLLQSILASQLPSDATYRAVLQGPMKPRVSLLSSGKELSQGASRKCTDAQRKQGNAGAWPQWQCLSQKSKSHSHAGGHFLHLTPTPSAGSQFSTVHGESGVSTLITARLMSLKKAGGSPTASEEETFDWDRSTLQPSGEPDISRTQKINFLLRRNMLSVWEKRERENGEGQYVLTLG